MSPIRYLFSKSVFKGTPTCASFWRVTKSTKSCHFKWNGLWEFYLLILSYHLQGTCSGYFRVSIAVSFQCGFIEATRTLDLQNCFSSKTSSFLSLYRHRTIWKATCLLNTPLCLHILGRIFQPSLSMQSEVCLE